MNFLDYQHRTADTAIYPGAGNLVGLTYTTMGLAGETGEICNKVKKIWRDHDGVVSDEMAQVLGGELGDVLWYISQLATELGLSLESVARANITKLADRKERNVLGGSGDQR